jgi:integrase
MTEPLPATVRRSARSIAEQDGYDRSPELTPAERHCMGLLQAAQGWGGRTIETILDGLTDADRLVRPLADALRAVEGNAYWKERALVALLRACVQKDQTFWGWSSSSWGEVLAPAAARRLTANHPTTAGATRHYMIAAGYLLGCLPDLSVVTNVEWHGVARKVFGRAVVDAGVGRVDAIVAGWGYTPTTRRSLRSVTARAMLASGGPELAGITRDRLLRLRRAPDIHHRRYGLVACLSRALTELGLIAEPVVEQHVDHVRLLERRVAGMSPEWAAWVARWEVTSTLAPTTRVAARNWLLKMGRWLQQHHADITGPQQWTRELAAEAVAAIDRMRTGDYCTELSSIRGLLGAPLSPRSRSAGISALSLAFRDSQEWGWIPTRFNPSRALATPRSTLALIGPSPRTIADDVWAKLLWAGLNLTAADLTGSRYPLELVRALAIVWLFAGLRSDEILRLRVGCARWQAAGGDTDVGDGRSVCLLDVPVHKTGTAYTKPVDPTVGDAIGVWETIRPLQPPLRDRKTGELITPLFCFRARPLTGRFINHSVIPALCRKAGVPLVDAKGAITSHRARATIATQLYNAKDPMTLFELQAWLGHRSPGRTQHYARITPTTLTKAYTDAGYFARNIRAIEVLVDREAVQSGAAATGTPWQYFDLGHGYCTYSFFEQCPHRMACARCDFYVPKESTRAQLLEAQGNLQRMVATIPLTEDERAAVDDGAAAVGRLLQRLADTPTPAGPTPRQLGFTPLPMIADKP